MKIGVLAISALGVACGLAAVPALADTVLYSTLGPGGAYDGTGSAPVEGEQYSGVAIGDSFSLASGATVTSVELALVNDSSPNDTALTVDIESNSSGLPGSVLASLTQVGTISPSGGLVTYDCSGAGCNLAAGTYWLVAAEPDQNSAQEWYFSYGDVGGTIAYNDDASATGPWDSESGTEEAFQINGAATPEPSSLLLLGSGLLGLAGTIKRRLTA